MPAIHELIPDEIIIKIIKTWVLFYERHPSTFHLKLEILKSLGVFYDGLATPPPLGLVSSTLLYSPCPSRISTSRGYRPT